MADSPARAAPGSGQTVEVVNRPLVVLCIMTATVMTSLDTTIANVALPHIQGSVSASEDQITWVLTSYIVASAIMTPLTGWLAGRIGRKRLFMISVAGFTFASALCGIANSLLEIVAFRLFQGVCGAALIPLSQSELLDIYPREQQGQAMALWGMGAMLGPVLGPALGGWLTENFSWRWVFYINLPFGIAAFTGISLYIRNRLDDTPRRLNFFGFLSLSLGVGALQLMLDRGQQKDWFGSPEIWVEALLAFVGFYWVAVQTLTAKDPFIPREVVRDFNFLIGTLFGFLLGVVLFATMSLLPPMLESLLGYPVVTTGLITAPRGAGTIFSMFLVGRLIGRVEARAIIISGLGITAFSLFLMTRISLEMGPALVAGSGLLQGVGVGLIFVPLSTIVFSTLPPARRTDAAGLFTLMRNIGAGVGISIMESLLVKNTQVVHADLISHVRPDNPNMVASAPAGWDLATQAGRALIDAKVTGQAAMVSYVDDFKAMMVIALIAMPLALMMRPSKRAPAPGEVHAME